MTRIGVLGGGQLGRMLALAGYPLGLDFRFLDPAPDAPAGCLAEHIIGDYSDVDVLSRFASGLDVITYEFENVPVDSARLLSKLTSIYPPPQALEMAQDRLVEKSFFTRLSIPTPDFAQVDTRSGLGVALSSIGLPAVLKTRRFGYDGKGQFLLREPGDVEQAWEALGGRPLILERLVPFDRELSVIAVRARSGEMAFYPIVENHHSEGILRLSLAPALELALTMQSAAEEYARRVLNALDYVGVLAIELFQVGGELIANEMAPRVHNSGHWTIEGAATSQFESHLRAIVGLPLGATTAVGFSAMLNIIGELPDTRAVLAVPDAHLHLYSKTPRPGRKLGHITLRASDLETLKRGVEQLRIAMPSPLS